MKIRNFWVFITLIIIFLSQSPVTGADDSSAPLFLLDNLQKFDRKGNVSLIQALENGNFLLASVDYRTGDFKLLIASSRGRVYRRIKAPVKDAEYITADSDGNRILLYSPTNFSFYYWTRKSRKWKLIKERIGATPGFALFGGRKSYLYFKKDRIYAWGYYYDRAGEYLDEGLATIDPEKQGEDSVNDIIRYSQMKKISKNYMPGAQNVRFVTVNPQYVVFNFSDNEQGFLVGYRRGTEEDFLIDNFKRYQGCDLREKSNILAYAVQPLGNSSGGAMFLYDLDSQLPTRAFPGRYFNPRFAPDMKKIGVLRNQELINRIRLSALVIIELEGEEPGGEIGFPTSEPPLLWKFTGRRYNYVTYITRDGVFRKKI
ncbi:MAG: hypothetical protein ACLFQV_01860 [Vulcanimicrobiota bacterium]